ncbi:hypothetical protein HC776_02885, partial [bacterium]|nr:hypothetical protein [bacterium]
MGFFGNLNAEKYDRQYTDSYLIRRIGRYMGRYRMQVFGIVTSFVVLSITASLQPILISRGVDALDADVSLVALIGGAILLAARLLDALQDPLLGWWSDRTAAASGSRLPFLVAAVPMLAVGMVGLFHPPSIHGEGLAV